MRSHAIILHAQTLLIVDWTTVHSVTHVDKKVMIIAFFVIASMIFIFMNKGGLRQLVYAVLLCRLKQGVCRLAVMIAYERLRRLRSLLVLPDAAASSCDACDALRPAASACDRLLLVVTA